MTDQAKKREVYFGSALIESYTEERSHNWIGISILPSAWKPFEQDNEGSVSLFQSERIWLLKDDVLLLNPLIKTPRCHELDHLGEIDVPYNEWLAPDFPNEIAAFRFIHEESARYIFQNDFSGRVASKYHATVAFLKSVLGPEIYQWAQDVVLRTSGTNQ
jgi:hypothetical protein